MNNIDLAELAKKLAPLLIDELQKTPSFYGNKKRFSAGHNVNTGNAHFNLSSGSISIGDYSFFGHNCSVITGTHYHNLKNAARHKRPKTGNDIVIGQGVWIGSGAIILGPCTIGDHAVVAAGSVVLPGNYAAECLYTGVPAALKKRINFIDETNI